MAIWQYQGELVPELWLKAKHGQIPNVLEDYLITEADIDRDAIESPHWWRDATIPDDIAHRANAILPKRESWSEDALMFGEEEASDLTIWFEDGAVDAVCFRWSLRDPDIELLRGFVALAQHLGAFVVSGDRATVITPDLDAVLRDVKQSNAYRFCVDPKKYLTEPGRTLEQE